MESHDDAGKSGPVSHSAVAVVPSALSTAIWPSAVRYGTPTLALPLSGWTGWPSMNGLSGWMPESMTPTTTPLPAFSALPYTDFQVPFLPGRPRNSVEL